MQRFEALEARAMLSAAPTVSDMQFGTPFPVFQQPTQISVAATDDVGVRAVTFFLDRNRNGRWDAATDQPLGDSFHADLDGRFSITAKPDASWPTYPAQASIVADAVDGEGQWATARETRVMSFAGRPVVSSFFVSYIAYTEGQQTPFMSVSLRAKVDEPFVYAFGGTNATFFLDKNFNGLWDSGVDVDLGIATSTDERGYRSGGTTILASHFSGQFCAVGYYSLSTPVTERFGDPSIATSVTGGSTGQAQPPVVTRATWQNLDDPQASGVKVGQRMRIEFVADTPDTYFNVPTLEAATLFFDSNFDQRWTAGADTDIGAVHFNADTLRGISRFDFTVTGAMGFDYRPFVITAKNSAGTWGPTYTVWPKIISPPWVENIAPTAASFGVAGQVSLTFTGRDDNAVQSVFAWVDRDGNGRFDLGEGYQQNAVRLSFTGSTSSWRATIDLAGLNYTAGTYRVYLIATDFQGAMSAATWGSVTLV